jgi:sulfite exporter TauE/SafE
MKQFRIEAFIGIGVSGWSLQPIVRWLYAIAGVLTMLVALRLVTKAIER